MYLWRATSNEQQEHKVMKLRGTEKNSLLKSKKRTRRARRYYSFDFQVKNQKKKLFWFLFWFWMCSFLLHFYLESRQWTRISIQFRLDGEWIEYWIRSTKHCMVYNILFSAWSVDQFKNINYAACIEVVATYTLHVPRH